MFPTTDKARAKFWFACALISFAINAMLLGPAVWAWALETPNAASWVQAIGSIVAVGVAVYAVSYQMNLASLDRAIQQKQKLVQDLAKAARLVEQAQLYSLNIAKHTLGTKTLDANVLAIIRIETEAMQRQLGAISSLQFADTPVLDEVTTSQSAASLLLEHAKSYEAAVSQRTQDQQPPTALHAAALDLSERYRSSSDAIRKYAREVESG